MKRLINAFLSVFLFISVCYSETNSISKPFSLTILHVNDTHAHLDPTRLNLKILTNETDLTRVEAGGFAKIVSEIKAVREKEKNILLLHAGDVFTGTLYFTQSEGMADLELMKLMGFDAHGPWQS